MTRPALKIEVVWADEHMLELCLSAANSEFAGQVCFYAEPDALAHLAERIAGFPRNTADMREYEFASADLPGHGRAKIRLRCKDGSGHLAVQVALHQTPDTQGGLAQSATLELDCAPADIDRFVQELQQHKQPDTGAVAALHNAR